MGRVRSLDRFVYDEHNDKIQFKKGQLLKNCYNKRVNIYEVHLHKNNKRKCFKIHRLVACAFLDNDDPLHKTTVNHKDGDRSNNCVNNLEWASYSENEKHSYKVLNRCKNSTPYKKRTCISIEKTTHQRINHESIASASRYTGISETQIRRIANKECINDKYDFIIK